MNCSNTLYIIASFLDLYTLVVVSSVNKQFYKICQKPALWKGLLMIEYFQDYDSFGDISQGEFCRTPFRHDSNWKVLLKKRVKSSNFGLEQGIGEACIKALRSLFCFVSESFSHPQIPLPDMGLDFQGFDTLFRNLLAGQRRRPDDLVLNRLESNIFMQLQDLTHNFHLDPESFNLSLNKTSEISNYLTYSAPQAVLKALPDTTPITHQIGLQMRKLILNHCKVTATYLNELEERQELLTEYLRRVLNIQWQAYTATMQSISDVISSLTLLGGSEVEIPDKHPAITCTAFMQSSWKTLVFNHLESEIHEIIQILFQIQRKRIGELLISSDSYTAVTKPIIQILQQSTRSIADLELNLENFAFADHSMWIPPAYQNLHYKVIEDSKFFYEETGKSPKCKAEKILKADKELSDLVWLPCTRRVLDGIRRESEIKIKNQALMANYEKSSKLQMEILEESKMGMKVLPDLDFTNQQTAGQLVQGLGFDWRVWDLEIENRGKREGLKMSKDWSLVNSLLD